MSLIDTIMAWKQALRDPQRKIAAKFLRDAGLGVSLVNRYRLVRQHYLISASIDSRHTTDEMLTFVREVLTIPKNVSGCIVHAGSYKGSDSAKFSLAAQLVGRRLVVCDSFRGLPRSAPDERQWTLDGRDLTLTEGQFAGSVDEVKSNIARYGALDVCEFVEGWFEHSLVNWNRPIAAIYLDIDLATSTRTCLKCLYPWLSPGQPLYSQDGHLPLVLKVFEDKEFWNREFGVDPPPAENIWKKKLFKITKPKPAAKPNTGATPLLQTSIARAPSS
jgi:O-methyltransferase